MKTRLGAPRAPPSCSVAPSAFAGAPQVTARAYLVQNGVTGEVLAQRHDRERLPIASITKLMTVLVTLEHARLDDVVTVSRPRGRASASRRSTCEKGDRLTVRELVEAALIQSANDAAVALAEHVGGSQAAFVAMMNAEAAKLGLQDTHFANPDGLDAPGHYSSAHDVTRLARIAMKNPVIREIVDRADGDDLRRAHAAPPGTTCSARYPGRVRRQDRPHDGGGLVGGRGRALARRHRLRDAPRQPGPGQRNADLAALLTWGLTRYRTVHAITPGRVYATAARRTGGGRSRSSRAGQATRIVRVDRPLVERVVAPTRRLAAGRAGARSSARSRSTPGAKLVASSPLVAARSIAEPGFLGRAGWYTRRTLHHVGGWFLSR